MINNWQTFSSPNDYPTALYNFFIETETKNQTPDYAAYADSRGFLSIGVGFNLTASNVQNAVFSALGLIESDPQLAGNPVLNADENGYITSLKAAIVSDNAAGFNAILAARSQDAALTAVLGPLPTGLSPAAARTVFNQIISTYEGYVDTWLPGIPASNERIALVSLAYNTKLGSNGLPTGLGNSLRNAINNGDRAEAWYQIRYGTNKDALAVTPPADAGGIAKRRYYESQVFGLYTVRDQPSQLEAAQAYQTLTTHRTTILAYERLYGTDPDGGTPEVPANRIATANNDYHLPVGSQVETLAQSLDSAFQLIEGQLQTLYGGVLPLINLDQSGTSDTSSAPFTIRSTDVYVAPTQDEINDGFATAADKDVEPGVQEGSTPGALAEGSRDHIVIGGGDGDTLHGGGGNDILVAGAGNETLYAGNGSDTLIGGYGFFGGGTGGADTLIESASATSNDVFVFAVPALGSATETIQASVVGVGAVLLDNYGQLKQLGGLATARLQAVTDQAKTWIDNTDPTNPILYKFIPGSSLEVGTLQITGSGIGSGNEIDIQKFNITKATGSSGFLGCYLQKFVWVTAGSNAGVDPPAPDFVAGSSQSYTAWVNAPGDTAQTVKITLAGASATDFGLETTSGIAALNSDGTFDITIPAGETSVSFTLVNTGDVDGNASLTFTAAIPDPADPEGGSVSGVALIQNYVEPSDDPFSQSSAGTLYDYGSTTSSSGTNYESYGSIQSSTLVGAVSSANNYIDIENASNDSIAGGSGNDSIFATFGSYITPTVDGGTDVIAGDGGSDIILLPGVSSGPNSPPPPAAVRIYADSSVDLQTAIADANSGTASGQQGDLIAVAVSATIVGGEGNDLIFADANNDVVVAGPGNETISGGFIGVNPNYVKGIDAQDELVPGETWAASYSQGEIDYSGLDVIGDYNASVGSGYEGNSDGAGEPAWAYNSTIFGGRGNDVIMLSNGDNDVQLGIGNATVLGGMGDNTIIGGGGNNSILGGGGNDYITAGDGNSYLVGRGGNNTLIGGAGTDTIFAGNDNSSWSTADTGGNYVQAGSGNTEIFGSGGDDTLLGGSGDDTLQGGAGNEYIVGGTGDEVINGGSGNDTLEAGGGGNDTIWGGSGNTTIYGGDGLDALHGGSGANVIYVGGGGTDAGATYADAGSGDTTISGGDGVDYLVGGTGNDVIYAGDGGDAGGATVVKAGSGNTTVYGGDGVDQIFGGSGTDVLYAGDGGTASAATLVEAGTGAATLYGGAAYSTLQDSLGGDDLLQAGDGTTDLFGIGNDTLVAGSGTDLLSGTGNNTYVLNSDGGDDEIVNAGGSETLEFSSGIDTTDISVSAGMYADGSTLLVIDDGEGAVSVDGGLTGANVAGVVFDSSSQNMTLASLIQETDAAGSAADSVIAGTQGNLVFDTAAGDSIAGGTGQDTVSAWGNNDTLAAGAGGTAIYAEGADAQVTGGSGSDLLAAFGTNATLTGGLGIETFEVNDTTDVVQAQAGAVMNTLLTSVNYTLPTNVDVMTLTGTGNLTVYGNSDSTNLITGNSGNDELVAGSKYDTLVSGTGVDTLIGGQGVDTFVVGNSNDVIQLPYGGSNDTVESSVSYALDVAAAALTLTGSANLTATDDYGSATITGNAGNDTLIGGSGRDTLVAGRGVDTLVAGAGNNTLVINNTADVIQLGGTVGNDTVESSVSYTLQQQLDTLVLTGTGNLVGQGNGDQSNSITGNSGDDTLIAGLGSDTLVAGTGTDTLIAGTGQDIFEGRAGDTYVLNAGFGSTRIDLSGAGTIKFGAGIAAADLSVTTVVDSKGNFALQISVGNSVLTLDDGQSGGRSEFGLPISAPLSFQFADGTQLDLAQLMTAAHVGDLSLSGASGNLVLSGDANATLLGGAGNDTLIGTGADDSIYAGSGNQTLYGLGEGDHLFGGLGADTLYGGQDSTFVASGGDTVIYGGGGSNTYVLTAGGTSTINFTNTASGFQTIVLPAGMTLGSFAAVAGSNGDLILRSLTDNTTAIISGFYNETYPGAWLVTDQNGDAQQLLNLTTPPSSGGGSAQDAQYEAKVGALLSDYQANTLATLNRIGTRGGLIEDTGRKTFANQYTFSGVTVDNLSVDGSNLNVAASESDQSHTIFTQSGTETITQRTPVYSSGTIPASEQFLQASDPFVQQIEQELEVSGQTLGTPTTVNGVSGYVYETQSQNYTYLSGYQTTSETVPVVSSYTTETLGFTDYNITGSGDGDVIGAAAPFVGTVVTGDGDNDSVNLGLDSNFWYNTNSEILGHSAYYPGNPLPLGTFIDVGNGLNDVILGTGGADTIAAGLGSDTIEASLGSTIYVPMDGASIDTIKIVNAPYYGNGPYPHNTLVLPDGVTPEDLQYRLFAEAVAANQLDPAGDETLQLTYGDSTVLLVFDSGAPSRQASHAQSYDTDGINYFQFSDGTVLTRAQVLAMAGPAITPDNNYNPVITQTTFNAAPGGSTPISDFFTVSDAGGTAPTVYQIANNNPQGAYFTLNGQIYGAGAVFDVAADQLSQLQYVAGAEGSTPQFSVSAFDGLNWGQAQNIDLTTAAQPNETIRATGLDQEIDGSSAGPDTLIGGFDGDTLVGASGQDTFVYNAGSGAETISETAPLSASSANVIQFGDGITPDSIYVSANSSGGLVLEDGNGGDSITIEGFDLLNPVATSPIQALKFADGTIATIWQMHRDLQGPEVTGTVANADGSTTTYDFNPGGDPFYVAHKVDSSGQLLQDLVWRADLSFQADTYSYNPDGSSVVTRSEGSLGEPPVTTEVDNYDTHGNLASDNIYTPSADGSYTDSWGKADGSSGSYWWNASTLEYQATWDNGSSGVTSTDTYQYSSGGSPSSSGVSFTETYTDTAGDQGTRQYDASTGITSVSWYSAATGTIAGAVTDSGFIGLQNDGELTNTQADPSFFNPTTSPAFQGFLAGH